MAIKKGAETSESAVVEAQETRKRRLRLPEGGRRIAITFSKDKLKELKKLGIDLETSDDKETLEFAYEFVITGAKSLAREGRAVTKEALMELIGERE